MANVILKGVTKKFGSFTALNDINIETKEGEFFFILGPSGAGKSTMFNLISGILPVTKGDIFIGGEMVNKLEPRYRDVAVAFESYALYPNKTVYQNLEFPLRAPIRKNQYTDKEIDKIVRETAELLHIDELLDRLPSQLSGGQKQRVSLGRTLVRRPKIFLLDEPIAHLDAKLRHRMRGELKRIQKEMGISAIFATPDQLEAVSMADRVAILNKGVIQQIGTPEEIYFHPANEFVASMVGDPKINIFRGSVHAEGGTYYICHKDFKLQMVKSAEKLVAGKALSGDIDIGIRPTCFRLSKTKMSEGDIQTRVSFMQRMGDTQIIKLDVGNFTFTTKVDQSILYSIGDIVWFSLSGDKIFFFDPETGKTLMS